MNPIIIALSGDSGVGKDTVADALQRMIHAHRCVCDIKPFALQVKVLAEAWGWSGGKTPKDRALLEGLTVLREEFDPGGWARDWAISRHLSHRTWGGFIIAPDHRGIPGFDALIDANGGHRFTIWRAWRAGDPSDDKRRPHNPKLRRWDRKARAAGVPIENNAPDNGESAAREIWARVKAKMEKENK